MIMLGLVYEYAVPKYSQYNLLESLLFDIE